MLLVFPLDVDASRNFITTAKALGIKVIGSSSVMESAEGYDVDEFEFLPFVTENHFEKYFLNLLKKHQINHIYAPHIGAWLRIKQLLKDNKLQDVFFVMRA